jgi:ATP-dependent DNA helicase 2 subunit 2
MQEEEDPNKKQRITWKDIIEKEEQKIREKQLAESGQQIEVAPITEEEAARLKDVKPDDEDPDAVK